MDEATACELVWLCRDEDELALVHAMLEDDATATATAAAADPRIELAGGPMRRRGKAVGSARKSPIARRIEAKRDHEYIQCFGVSVGTFWLWREVFGSCWQRSRSSQRGRTPSIGITLRFALCLHFMRTRSYIWCVL